MLAVVCEELGGVTVTQFHGPRQGEGDVDGGVSRCFPGVRRRAAEDDLKGRMRGPQSHSFTVCFSVH